VFAAKKVAQGLVPTTASWIAAALAWCCAVAAPAAFAQPAVARTSPAHAALQDGIAQRVDACTTCHGADGRAGPDGYYPRLAGKPAGYLANQLLNFRDGRRSYAPMVYLLDHLSDAYLHEMAGYFAALDVPYPAPARATEPPAVLARGQQLVMRGDAAKGLPACVRCHGQALTGVAPAIPGLLGLPRHYLAGQIGAWHNGRRRAQAPDCMADIARRLSPDDVGAVASWLSSQPWPAGGKPVASLPQPLPMPCGGVPRSQP
jgi:cytochrome c553